MKQIITALFFGLLSTYASGVEIKITSMTPEGDMDRSFVLGTSLPERIVLDCQSFVQGLNLGGNHLIILEPEECEGLQDRIYSSLIQSEFHCLEVDDELRGDSPCH